MKDFILKGSLIGEQSIASVWDVCPRFTVTYSLLTLQIQDFMHNFGGFGARVHLLRFSKIVHLNVDGASPLRIF